MADLTSPAGDLARAYELLAVARMILSFNHHRDLVEKVTVLQGYVELSGMSNDRDYGPLIRMRTEELAVMIQGILN